MSFIIIRKSANVRENSECLDTIFKCHILRLIFVKVLRKSGCNFY